MGPFPNRTLIATGAVILVVLGLVWAVLAWGQGRYDAGVKDADAKWLAASAKLQQEARSAGTAADAREASRIADHTAAVAEERKQIDEAVADGRSPLDVLFGGGVRDDARR